MRPDGTPTSSDSRLALSLRAASSRFSRRPGCAIEALFILLAAHDILFHMTIEDLEKAVADLPPGELARFRAWFEQFDVACFDQKIKRDAKAGKLDRLARGL
jgi:hypothetical protein